MCGIIGYIGNKNALPIIIDSLKNLEYRGYDSSGVAYIVNKKIKIVKEAGKISNLEKQLKFDEITNISIGHTRWATHGIASTKNAHPHQNNKITIVHNGIIENYLELKKILEKNNYSFKSDTDTEIAAAYIDYLYNKEKNILKVLDSIKNIFLGSYAFGIILKDDTDHLYSVRKNSPLIIGIGKNENFIASDMPAIINYTKEYYLLDNDEVAIISKNDIKIYKNEKEIKKEKNTFEFNIESAMKNGYEHFMLKEINEQEKLTDNLINYYLKDKKAFLNKMPSLAEFKEIFIVACGSAYHAGLVGKILIEKYGNIPVSVEIASEFRYKKLFLSKKSLVIIISQSGETADSLASLRLSKEHRCKTLAIVNVVGSSIAREADKVLYIYAGCEIAVATTKAYSLQVLTLSLLAFSMGLRNKTINNFEKMKEEYLKLPRLINKQINNDYRKIAKEVYKYNDIYFIGRNIDYAIAMEGSLKLKEISYIHSECYPAGELKHGTISLIEKNTPVISIITEKNIIEKTLSNIKEVESRGANVILFILSSLDSKEIIVSQKIIVNSGIDLINPIISIIPLQLLSYYVAKYKKCDIDKPRNLAKSVTVE